MKSVLEPDAAFMRLALRLARRGRGRTSPNPMVGAVLTQAGRIVGAGWHRQAGGPHAEIEALRDAAHRGERTRGATLYVTLEPCSTHGRTPPCTDAVAAAGIRRVVVGATDPNPRHAGRGFELLRQAGLSVTPGVLGEECAALNQAFNHWIVRGTPWVTLKAAMSLDGRIATARGQSQWITGPAARRFGMQLRRGADAVLVGIDTVLADDPRLTLRPPRRGRPWRRIVLDSRARTPLDARLVAAPHEARTTVVVTRAAPARRVEALRRRVEVVVAPAKAGRVDLAWLLRRLGAEEVVELLVEGGGEIHASFLEAGLAHRVAFLYAPLLIGGSSATRAVGGQGAQGGSGAWRLAGVAWRRLGTDFLLTGRLVRG